MILLGTYFNRDFLLQLFRKRVLNKPAVILIFRILNLTSVLICEWEFFSIVLAKNHISIKTLFLWNGKVYKLIFIAKICKNKSRSKNFSANKLPIINHIRIDVHNVIDVNNITWRCQFRLLTKNTLWFDTEFDFLSRELTTHLTSLWHCWVWRNSFIIRSLFLLFALLLLICNLNIFLIFMFCLRL